MPDPKWDFSTLSKYGINNIGDAQAQTQGYNLSNLSRYLGNSDEHAALYGSLFGQQIGQNFEKQLGRKGSQAELASVFNNLDFAGLPYFNVPNAPPVDISRIGNPMDVVKNALNDEQIGGHLKALQPKFNEVQMTRDALSQYGADLPEDIVSQMVASSTPLEEARKLGSSYANKTGEAALSKKVSEFGPRYSEAIDALDQALSASQSKFFGESVQPQVESSLNARGILGGGQLNASLAEQAGKLNTAREATIAPLRFEGASGAINKDVENVMRQALAGGKSLDEAMSLANNIYTGNLSLSNQMALGTFQSQNQAELDRQKISLMMALNGGNAGGDVLGGALSGLLSGGAAGASSGNPWAALIGAGVGAGLGGYSQSRK